jgi:hypothetical protein
VTGGIKGIVTTLHDDVKSVIFTFHQDIKGLVGRVSTFIIKIEDAITGMVKLVIYNAITLSTNILHDMSILGSNISKNLSNGFSK